jgi:hypothetical protein
VLDVSQPPAEVLSSIARKLTPKEAAPKAPQPVEYAPGFVEVYSGELKNILEQPTGISCSLLFGTFSKVATDSGNWLAGNLPGRSLPSGQLYLVPKMENATPANYDAEFQAAYDKVPQSKASGAVRIVKPAVVDVTTSKIIQKGLVNFQ